MKHVVQGEVTIEPGNTAFLICSQMSILHVISGGNANKSERAEKSRRRRSYKRYSKRKCWKRFITEKRSRRVYIVDAYNIIIERMVMSS